MILAHHEHVLLAGPDAVKTWSEAGKNAPTCLEASDKVVMVVTDTATSFLDAATGKSVFHPLNTTNESSPRVRSSPSITPASAPTPRRLNNVGATST